MATETFIATEPLFIGRARAHNKGDVVPAENVERNGWSKKVARAGTKAAQEAQGAATEDSTPSTSTPAVPPKS